MHWRNTISLGRYGILKDTGTRIYWMQRVAFGCCLYKFAGGMNEAFICVTMSPFSLPRLIIF